MRVGTLLRGRHRLLLAGAIAITSLLGCRAILDIHDPPAATGDDDDPDKADSGGKTKPDGATGGDDGMAPFPAVPACAGASVPMQPLGTINYVPATFGRLDGGVPPAAGPVVIDLLYPTALNPAAFPASAISEFTCDPAGFPTYTSSCTISRMTIGDLEWTDDAVDIYSGEPVAGSLPNEMGTFGVVQIGDPALVTIAPAFAKMYAVSDDENPCTEAQLSGAGFLSLSTTGFYSRDEKTLRPFSDVRAGGKGKYPNTPTVSTKIAGTTALATLDSSINDDGETAIIVNTPLLTALLATGKLTRAAQFDRAHTLCSSTANYTYEGYTLADDASLELVGEQKTVKVHYPSAVTIIGLRTAAPFAEDDNCLPYLMETWTVPAARVQGSFFSAVGVVIVDAGLSRVWVPNR